MTPSTHAHDFLGQAHDRNARRTLWVAALSAAMMVGEVTAGWLTGSMALLADGFHMATDAGALAVAAGAYAYARRHAADPRFSFGTGKVGDLVGFASALVLGLVSFGIGVESVLRLVRPSTVDFGPATAIAVVGLLVNLASAFLLGGHAHGPGHADHAHDHGHGHAHDNNLRSAYMHVLADALTSVLAIAALLAGRYLGWVWMDPGMGIVGAAVIARWSWSLMRDTAHVLLDATDERIAFQVRQLIEAPGDARITDLHVWRVGPEAHAAVVSLTGVTDGGIVRDRLLAVRELRHLTVEVH